MSLFEDLKLPITDSIEIGKSLKDGKINLTMKMKEQVRHFARYDKIENVVNGCKKVLPKGSSFLVIGSTDEKIQFEVLPLPMKYKTIELMKLRAIEIYNKRVEEVGQLKVDQMVAFTLSLIFRNEMFTHKVFCNENEPNQDTIMAALWLVIAGVELNNPDDIEFYDEESVVYINIF